MGNTDGMNGDRSPHDREDAVDVVFLEAFHVSDAGDVAEPEVLDHLVHGGIWENRRFMSIYETGSRPLYGNACLRQIINQWGQADTNISTLSTAAMLSEEKK